MRGIKPLRTMVLIAPFAVMVGTVGGAMGAPTMEVGMRTMMGIIGSSCHGKEVRVLYGL